MLVDPFLNRISARRATFRIPYGSSNPTVAVRVGCAWPLLCFPDTRILFSIFEVRFGFNQRQRGLLDLLVFYHVVYIPECLKDVEADQGTVLFADTFLESTCEAI